MVWVYNSFTLVILVGHGMRVENRAGRKRQYCTTASKYGAFGGITFIKQQKALSAAGLPLVDPINNNTA
jgi:hypothetical protein